MIHDQNKKNNCKVKLRLTVLSQLQQLKSQVSFPSNVAEASKNKLHNLGDALVEQMLIAWLTLILIVKLSVKDMKLTKAKQLSQSLLGLSIDWYISSTWCQTRDWPRLQNNRTLHHILNSGCNRHLWRRFHDSNKLQDPREMLQVLRRLGEGGQKSGLWNLLRCWWREEAGCDGGNFWFPLQIFHH